LVENRQFEPTPPLFGAPVWDDLVVVSQDFCRQETRVPGLSNGVVYVILGLDIFVQLRFVTDRQTAGQTHDDS